MDKQIVDLLASCPYCQQSFYDVGEAYLLSCGHYVCRECMPKLKNGCCALDGSVTSNPELVQLRPWLTQHMQYYSQYALWQDLIYHLQKHNANRPCLAPQCNTVNCPFDHTGRFRNLGLCPLSIACKRPQTCAFQHIAQASDFRTGGIVMTGLAASAYDQRISLPVANSQTSPRSHPTLPAHPVQKPGPQVNDSFYCEQTMVKPRGSITESPSAETAVSRSLLKELVELRQVRVEKDSLQQANIHYMTLVSHLELTMSELKVQLQAKDAEIAKWKARTKKLARKLEKSSEEPSTPSAERSKEELASRVQQLEEENRQLKSHAALSSEMERLRLQLEQSNKLQTMYRDKYQETKVKLVTLATERSNESVSTPDPVEKRVQRKTEASVNSLSPIDSHFSPQITAKHPASRLRRMTPTHNSDSMAFLIPESRTPVSCKTSVHSLKSSPMASFVCKIPSKNSALISHKSNTHRRLKRSEDLRSPGLSVYIPSFTRSRKNAAPRPTTECRHGQLDTVNDESEFADYFPEERELD